MRRAREASCNSVWQLMRVPTSPIDDRLVLSQVHAAGLLRTGIHHIDPKIEQEKSNLLADLALIASTLRGRTSRGVCASVPSLKVMSNHRKISPKKEKAAGRACGAFLLNPRAMRALAFAHLLLACLVCCTCAATCAIVRIIPKKYLSSSAADQWRPYNH